MLALGDMTERFLRLFGITKERVQAVTGTADCGCKGRQAAMNDWGYRWQGRVLTTWAVLQHKWRMVRHGAGWHRLRLAAFHIRTAARILVYGR